MEFLEASYSYSRLFMCTYLYEKLGSGWGARIRQCTFFEGVNENSDVTLGRRGSLKVMHSEWGKEASKIPKNIVIS